MRWMIEEVFWIAVDCSNRSIPDLMLTSFCFWVQINNPEKNQFFLAQVHLCTLHYYCHTTNVVFLRL